jgi:hypothetical protein
LDIRISTDENSLLVLCTSPYTPRDQSNRDSHICHSAPMMEEDRHGGGGGKGGKITKDRHGGEEGDSDAKGDAKSDDGVNTNGDESETSDSDAKTSDGGDTQHPPWPTGPLYGKSTEYHAVFSYLKKFMTPLEYKILWQEVEDVIVKMFLIGANSQRATLHDVLPYPANCFGLYAVDLLISPGKRVQAVDVTSKSTTNSPTNANTRGLNLFDVYVMEINSAPILRSLYAHDNEVKQRIVEDHFRIAAEQSLWLRSGH